MTFEQFQATGTWHDDLRIPIPDTEGEDVDFVPQGRVYLGALHIEKVTPGWPEEVKARGAWYLLIGNQQWVSDDLEKLERLLYDFAVAEGYEVDA